MICLPTGRQEEHEERFHAIVDCEGIWPDVSCGASPADWSTPHSGVLWSPVWGSARAPSLRLGSR